MDKSGVDQPLETCHQLGQAFGRQVEVKQLDCNQSFLLRIVCPEDRPESSRANLMKHTKWTERIGWHGAGSFNGQRVLL